MTLAEPAGQPANGPDVPDHGLHMILHKIFGSGVRGLVDDLVPLLVLHLVGDAGHDHLCVANPGALQDIQLVNRIIAHQVHGHSLERPGTPWALNIRGFRRHVKIRISPVGQGGR